MSAADEKHDDRGRRLASEPTVTQPGQQAGAEPSDLPRGTNLGRHVILGRLGAGGMGVVYAAYDTALDRKVALKLVHATRDADAEPQRQERLVREARAIAQLSDPNVVAVYDVDSFDGQVFITMEHVEGVTLTEWLGRCTRSWREVLRVFCQAGRGLAAAHRAGVVHRDFKPDNVLVGADGRVRVTDFGIAHLVERMQADPPSGMTNPDETAAEVPEAFFTRLTARGSCVGTPAYMAPEQLTGAMAGPAADQFSFCTALYEALYGERPFAKHTPEELVAGAKKDRAQARGDELRPEFKRAGVPARLRRILLRGLRLTPDGRYPSMRALVAELEQDPSARRRRVLLVLGACVLLGFSIFSLVWPGRDTSRLCRGAAGKLGGVWDHRTKPATKAAFLATGSYHAAQTYERVEKALDRYVARWVQAWTDACEATHVLGEQSERLLDLRMHCLERRRGQLQALTELFVRQADEKLIERAVQAVSQLGRLQRCADTEALQAAVPPPTDPAEREQVRRLRARLDQAKALEHAGRYRQGLQVADEVAEQAREVGYAPLMAEALYRRGNLLDLNGNAKQAETELYEAARMAAEAKDDALVANAWIELMWVVGEGQVRPEAAMAMHRFTETVLARVGDDATLRSRFLHVFGSLHMETDQRTRTCRFLEESLALSEKAKGPAHFDQAAVLNTLANCRKWLGDYDRALEHYERALEIEQLNRGPIHPGLAPMLNNLGALLAERGRFDEARRKYERALGIREKALGPEHPDIARSLSRLGMLLTRLGQLDLAWEYHQRALAIREKALGSGHPAVVSSLDGLGFVLESRGALAEARTYYERALAVLTDRLPAGHPRLAKALHNLGHVLFLQGKLRLARSRQERALAIFEKAFGSDNPMLSYPLTGLGRIHSAAGRPLAALPLLERALAIRQKAGIAAYYLGETRFALARALWSAGGDRQRAISLGRQAHDDLKAAKEQGRKELTELEAWLAERAPQKTPSPAGPSRKRR